MGTKYKHIRPADIYAGMFPEQPAADAPHRNRTPNEVFAPDWRQTKGLLCAGILSEICCIFI